MSPRKKGGYHPAKERLPFMENEVLRVALRKWICARKLQQKAIAQQLGVDDCALSQWLSGEKLIYAETAPKIRQLIEENNAT